MREWYTKSKQLFWGTLQKIHPVLFRVVFRFRIYVRYLLAGGTAAFVNLVSLAFFVEVLTVHYLPASALAFCFGLVASFILQKYFTFGDTARNNVRHQALVYFSIALGNLFLNTFLVFTFVGLLGLWYLFSQALASIVIAVMSFILYRFFVFIPEGKEAPISKTSLAGCALLFVLVVALYVPSFLHLRELSSVQALEGIEFPLPVYGSDSVGFITLSEGLLQHHFLGTYPDHPDTFRTPGYPLMLAGWKSLFGSYEYFPVLQISLAYLTAVLLFLIGRRLFSSVAGLIAGALFIVDPNTLYHSLVLLSEIPHVFLLTLAVFFVLVPHRRVPLHPALWAGIALALAALVKPVSMYIPLLFVAFLLYRGWEKKGSQSLKQSALSACILLLVFGAGLMPWLLRNNRVSGAFGLSSVASFNLFHYTVPEFLSSRDGITPDEGRLILREEAQVPAEELSNLMYSSFIQKVAVTHITDDPFRFASFYAVKTIPFFFSSSLDNLFVTYNDVVHKEMFSPSTANLTNLILQRNFSGLFAELRAHPLVFAEQLFLGLLLFFAFVALFNRARFGEVAFLFLSLFYFAVVTGVVAYARLRIPASPFLFLLAASGFLASIDLLWRLTQNTKGTHSLSSSPSTTSPRL